MKRFSDYLREELEYSYLLEGVSASYDVGKLADNIKKTIGNKIKEIQYTELPPFFKETKYGNVFTVNMELKKSLDEFEKNDLNSILDFFGYTESSMYLNPLSLQIEPKYPVKINGFLKQYDNLELFHVTEKKYLNKIENMGLAPKKSKTSFSHPSNRIYYITIIYPRDKKRVLTTWKNVLSRDKKVKPSDMIILKTKFNPSHNYYFDDTSSILNMGIIGMFSLNNVNPNDLSVYDMT